MGYSGYAFIDWDDTLAENLRYFRRVELELSAGIAAETGFSEGEIRARGEEIDASVARRIGLAEESFGLAWVECYREFCARAGVAPDAGREDEIRRACLFPYRVRQELYPGARELLHWLRSAGFEITIWTAGAKSVQMRKIAESGLAGLIDRRVIVLEKSAAVLARALGGRDPKRSFVLGNSLHSDIAPALALGLLALHVQRGAWAYDETSIDGADPNYVALDGLEEVAPVIASRFCDVDMPAPPDSAQAASGGEGA